MSDFNLGMPITNPFGERFYPSINHQIFAQTAAEDVFQPYFDALFEMDEALFVVVGTDSGLLPNFIQSRSHHPKVKWLFIELESVLQALDVCVNQASDLDALPNSESSAAAIWFFDSSFSFEFLNQAFASYVLRRKVFLIKSLAVMDAPHHSAYAQLWEAQQIALEQYHRAKAGVLSHKVYEEQRLLNVADNFIPAKVLRKTLQGVDAVILTGGPTLDDSIQWVKENQDRLIIFAAARIAKRLQFEAIAVDFYVTVDPYDLSFDNSKLVLNSAEHSILLHCYHANRRLVSQWRGLKAYLGQRYAWRDLQQSSNDLDNIAPLGPTVTNTAVHLAYELGASRIFLSGVDFCFAKGKTYESKSTEVQHSDKVARSDKVMLENNLGQMIETANDFFAAKNSMDTAVQAYVAKRPDLSVISLGAESAKIQNIDFQPAGEIVLAMKPEAKQALMLGIKTTLQAFESQYLGYLNQCSVDLMSQQKRFSQLHQICQNANALVDKLHDKMQTLVPKVAKEISASKRKIEKRIGEDGKYMVAYQALIFSEGFGQIVDVKTQSVEQIKAQLHNYFAGLAFVSKALVNLITHAQARVQLRLNEAQGKTGLAEMAPLWEKWQEYGRVFQWQIWHSEPGCHPQELEQLQQVQNRFTEDLLSSHHVHQQKLEAKVHNLAAMIARANRCFLQKQSNELQEIAVHVQALESIEQAQKQDFLDYLHAMILQLEGKLIEAFNVYESIQTSVLRHLALKKMLPIAFALNNSSAAILVLERLLELNPQYFVPYADLLWELGEKQRSLKALHYFSQQFPDKLSEKNKLASRCLSVGLVAQAVQLVTEVLHEKPDNLAALALQQTIAEHS